MSDYADNLRNSLGMDRDLSVPAGRYEEQKAAEEARLAEEKAREERAAAAGDRYYQGFLERRGFVAPEEDGQAGAPAAAPKAFDAEGFLSRANLTRDDIYAPLYDGAPSGVYKPAAYSTIFREMIKASDQPLEMENRLNSAYYLAMMEGIPFDEAFNNFEAISTAYYGSALSPKSWHKAVQTTWQAATISTEISKLAYKLGQKGGADQEIMNRIRELESYIPQADEIKRNLPTEALKAAAQFIPSQLESVVAGVTGGAIGGALAVATGGFGTVAIPTIAMFGYRMGGAIGAGLKTHELETGALYYDLLKYEERSVGEDGQEKVERVNPEVAWHVAQIYGLVAAATELLPMDHFLKGLGGAVGLGKAVEKTSSVASAASRAGKVRDIFLKFLGKQKSALAEGIMDVGMETVQEVVQETANIVAAEYAKEITNSEWGTSLDPITREEAQARIQETLVQSFIGMGVLSGAKGGIKLMVSGAKTAKTAADASKTMKAEEKAMDGYELKPEDMELYRKRADEALPANVRIARSTILEGSEYAMHAVDSTTGKSMATLRYEFEAGKGETPGTVRVLGLKSGAAPRVNAELMTALMRQFPGWNVEFNPQNANQAALKALLVERNPRGAAAGMQWYYAEKGLPDANTLKYMDERLRDVAPGWNDADRLAAVNTVSLWASKMGMTGDQLADAIFAPGVFTPQTNRILTADKIAQGAAGATSWQGVGKAFKALIDIAPNANPSTMLHESSHAVVNFMLEVRRGAIKVAQKDQVLGLLSDMEKALGVENGNWDAQFTGWTEEAVQGNRSYWEALTYAMEDYLAFGKAPKPELKGLFARFAKWIMDIYQGLKAARVQMSPELSAFFDRLFDDADSVFGEEAQTISEADLATTAEPDDIAGEPPLEIYQGERANRQQQRSQRAGLSEAKRMEAAGRTMDEIAAATGWQKVDGDWRARKDRRWGEALSPEAQEAMKETARRPRQVNGAADKAFPDEKRAPTLERKNLDQFGQTLYMAEGWQNWDRELFSKLKEELTREELEQVLTLNEVSGIAGRRAYREDLVRFGGPLPVQASLDADSLKWVNDNLGHEAGDEMLRRVAWALDSAAKKHGVYAYHFSGDEYAVQGETVEAVIDAINEADDILAQVTLEAPITGGDGARSIVRGLRVSAGLDGEGDLHAADRRLAIEKSRKEKAGERAGRGEIPVQIEIRDAAGGILDGDRAREYIRAAERARQEAAQGASRPADDQYDPERIRHLRESRRAETRRPTQPLYSIVTHHGAKAGFSRFSLSYMGTGEGQQVYGWGLYFTENRGVAKGQYAERLGSRPTLTVPPKREEDSPYVFRAAREAGLLLEDDMVRELRVEITERGAGFDLASPEARQLFKDTFVRLAEKEIRAQKHSDALDQTKKAPAMETALKRIMEDYDWDQASIEGGRWLYEVEIHPKGKREGKAGTPAGAGWDAPISQKQLNRLGSVTAGWDEYGVIEFEKEYGYTPNDTIIEGAEDTEMTVGAFIAGLVDAAISGEDGDIDTGADLWAGLMRHINDVDFVKKLLEEADLTDIYPGEGATATVMTPEMIKQGQADLGTHIGDYTADDIADFYADFIEDGVTTEPKYVQTILDAIVHEITKKQAEIPTVTAEAIEAWLEIDGYFNPESQPPEVKAHTDALTMIAMEVLDRYEEGRDEKRSHAAIAAKLYFAGPDGQPVLFIRPNENTPRAVEAEEGRWLRWDRPAPREDMDAVRAALKTLHEEGNDPIRATFELGERDDAGPMRGRIQTAINNLPEGTNKMGEGLYNTLRQALGGKKEASLLLKAAGFDGVKFPVAFLSGGTGDKGFNYVVFDEEALQVRNRILFQGDFGKQIDVPQGSVTTAILALQNAKAGIVEAAATRAPIGDIAIPWGWEGNESKGFNDGVGLAKIIRKHEQRDQVLVNLGSILKEGAIYQDPVFNERVWFIWGQYRAVVSTYRGKGADRRWGPWLMTAYIPEASRSSGKPIIPAGAVLIEPGTEPETPKKTVIKIKRRKTLLQGEGAKRIEQLKPAIARAAQDIYDAWDQDEEGVDEAYGTGGICDEIASQIGSLLIEDGWEIVDGGWDGDDHAFVIAVSETEAYAVDIPPQVYETGGGYSWTKKPGVKFSPDDIVVYEVDRENVIDENETLYQAEAYHGTPWDFDEFDTGKIGTGEGAQAFGWGLYFTNNEEIAKGYAQKLTRKQLADGDFIEKIDGVPVAEWGKGVQFAMESARMGGATRVNEILHVFKLVINSGRFKGEELEAIKRAREAIAAGNAELGLVEGRRRLYNVTLWEGKDAVLLDWNRPLYEQDDKVIEALARMGIKLPTMEEVQDAHTEAENNLLEDLLGDIDSPTDPEIDVQWNEEAQAWDYFFDGQYAGWSDTEDGAWDAAEEEAADAGMQRRAEIETNARDQLSEDDVREEAMAILGEKGYSTNYAMTWGDYWHALLEAGGPFDTHEDKAAHSREISLGLLNAGIDGVRFPAASNGMGTGSAGWNYVVFDDAEVTIKRKVIYQGERARQSNALLQGGEEPDNGASQLYGLVREMSAEGKSWEEFAEYVEGTKDWLPNSASAPDLPPDQKLGWYKTVWDEAMLDARRGTDLNKWMKDLADNKHAGLKGFLRAIWTNVLLREREEPPYGTTAADAAAWGQEQQRAGAIRQLLAEPIIAGAISLGAKSDTLSNQYLASVMGIIRANPEEYASIYGEVTGDEKIGKLGAQAAMAKYEDIKDPRMKQRMSISERAALAAQIRDKELEKDVLAGRVTDDRVKEYIDKLKKNAQADRRRLEKLAAEIKEAEAAVDARGREIADARVKLTQANAEARRIAARVKAYLDKNATVPAALETQKAQIEKQREATRQRLVNALDWMEIEKELEKQKAVVNRALLAQDEYRAKGKDTPATVLKRKSEALARIRELEPKLAMAKEYKNSAQLQTYLAKLETETKIKDRIKVRDAERRAAQKLRSYREGLAKRIMKTAGDGIHVSYQKDIRKIQAAINPENPSAKTMESINLLRAELEKNPELASEVPKKWLQRAIGKNLNEMTLEELESTERRVRELRDAGREKQRRIEEQRAEQAEEYRSRIADILMALPGYKEPRGYEGEKSWEEKLLLKFQEFNYGWMNAQRFAERMDGGTQGQNYELLILERDRHYRVARENIARRRQAIMDGLKELGIDPAEWYNTEVTILGAGPGRTNKTLRKSDLLAIEMAFRNEDSRQAVLFGDFFSAKEKQAMDEDEIMMEGAHRFGIIRAAIDANLTAKDREALEKVFRKDAAEAGPRLAETVAEAENREMAEVDDYFPIRREGVTGDPIDVQLAGEMLNRTSGLRRPPKNGFTKSRVKISPAHQSPVKLDLLSTWLESIEHQEHYMATVMYGKRLDAFYLSPFVQEQVRGAFGDAGIEYLKEYITEIKNPGSQRHHNRWENSIRWLRGNLGVAYLAFRASSVLKQLVTSPWPALPYAGPRLFTEAMKMMVNPVGYVRDTEAMSTVLANRTQDMVFEAIRANAKARGLGKAMNAVNEYGMKGLELVDRLCVAVGWRAMYEAELAKNGGDHQKALERADDLTLRTQPSSRGVDLAPIYRKAGEGTRLLLQFTQALNVVYQNIRYDLPLAVRNHQWGTAIGTIVGYMIAGVLLNAVVAGPDEDEENRYLFWAFTQATESIPLIGMEATRIMRRAITGAKEPMMPDTALPGIGNILDGMYRLTGGEIEKGLIEFATGGGMILGLPVNGIREAYRATTGDPGALMGKPKKE